MIVMSITYFTLEQANNTLPLVRRIAQDIVDDYQRWKANMSRYEAIAARDRPTGGESAGAEALRAEVDAVAARINDYIDELKQIGCVLKGFDDGLVDFHSKLDDRDIFLCWKLGEDLVSHWHEIDSGFAARQPVAREPVGGGQGP